VRELDYTELAAALERGAIEETGAVLGLVLDEKTVAALRVLSTKARSHSSTPTPGLPRLLGLLHRAVHSEEAHAYTRVESGYWRLHMLALRAGDRVAVDAVWNKLQTIGGTWPDLKVWSNVPAWVKTPDRLVVDVRPSEGPARIDDESALKQAVLDAPEDDAPRLVYADWLLERGDVRGELIRLQCTTYHDLKRADAILKVSASTFAGEAAPYKPVFARGFVDEVAMSVAAFAKHGERVFGTEPVRKLDMTRPSLTAEQLKKLAATPALRLVRELHLGCKQDTPLAALGASPHLERLKVLRLQFCGASTEDWREFLETLRAPALEELHFVRNSTSAGVYEGLARNNSVRLRLLSEDCLRDLGGAGSATRTNAALGAFARSPAAARLEIFRTYRGKIDVDGLDALLAATRLKRLIVTSADWTKEQVNKLAALLLSLPPEYPLRAVALPGLSEATAAATELLKGRFEIL
jgi:uncharacterized protein (TIGR02996 family)